MDQSEAEARRCSLHCPSHHRLFETWLRKERAQDLYVVPTIFLLRNLLQHFGLMLTRQATFCEGKRSQTSRADLGATILAQSVLSIVESAECRIEHHAGAVAGFQQRQLLIGRAVA